MTRLIYFGMTGGFSIPPLEKLIAAGVEVGAVIVPTSSPANKRLPRRLEPSAPAPTDLPILNPHLNRHILHLAWSHHLPVWEVGNLSNGPALEMLAALDPDLIAVACFPYRFPPDLLQLPRYGCLNLHPSLLPAYRGPAPLFWMARQGERQAGVTLHFLDEGLDTGDIVAQTAFVWPKEVFGSQMEQQCAEAGADLLLEAVEKLAHRKELLRRPQPPEGSYFPWPTERDFLIPTDWQAGRAFIFWRSADEWPLLVEVGDERFRIRVAIGYDLEQRLDQPYIFHDNELWIQFQPGVLRVKI